MTIEGKITIFKIFPQSKTVHLALLTFIPNRHFKTCLLISKLLLKLAIFFLKKYKTNKQTNKQKDQLQL